MGKNGGKESPLAYGAPARLRCAPSFDKPHEFHLLGWGQEPESGSVLFQAGTIHPFQSGLIELPVLAQMAAELAVDIVHRAGIARTGELIAGDQLLADRRRGCCLSRPYDMDRATGSTAPRTPPVPRRCWRPPG